MAGDGLTWQGQCYRDRTELAQLACGSISGTTNGAAVLDCKDPSVTGTQLHWTATWTQAGTAGPATPMTTNLQACEPYDFEWWSPVLAAFFLALVSVLCVRMIIAKVFNRDSSV